jgi:hypothetical protein|tara:strand:- start:5134 stop:7131 length:1998 start_codon:yes stop_codon:yes gene_type:complete
MPTPNPRDIDYGTNKKVVKKEVSYLGRDFRDIRQNLIEFAKSYFPNQYNDFNEASPGMMFVEMASYVGDVLNYYVDNQFRETLLNQAEERKNIYEIAQSYGYRPKLAAPSSVKLTFAMDVPASGSGAGASFTSSPDMRYASIINSGTILKSTTGIEFSLLDDVNFKVSSSLDDLESIPLTPASGDVPTSFRLFKTGLAKSGITTTEQFTFGTATKFDKITLDKEKITEVVSVTDSDGGSWYEVPFLAQDTVFETQENTTLNDPSLSQYQNESPYLLKLIKTSRRFNTRVNDKNKTEIRFGSGISDNADEEIIPNPDNVGSALGGGVSRLDESFDPSNFLKTQTFGLSPANTTLTVTYRYGGAVEHNVPVNSITMLNSLSFTNSTSGIDSSVLRGVQESIQVTNLERATGGASQETLEDIKLNASAYFNAQNRAVTKEDYVTRVYSLPQKYGNVAKAFIVQDEQLEQNGQLEVIDGVVKRIGNIDTIPNPLALNLYMLGYTSDRKLTQLNEAVKQNVKTYLSQYRILTDAINIKDAYVTNVGVRFGILVRRGFNKNEVLFRAIQAVKKHFEIKKWQINQPIVLNDIAYVISLVEGVISVVPPQDNNPNKNIVVIENKHKVSEGYSGNIYDMDAATRDGIVYPSLDPSIFELKYPDIDIEGRVVGDR